jgi:hypothetical protein
MPASIQGSPSGAIRNLAGCCLSPARSQRSHQARSSLLQEQVARIERRARAAATFAIHGNDRAISPTKTIKHSATPSEDDVADAGPTSCNGEIGSSFDSAHSLFIRNPRSVHILLLTKLGAGRGLRFVQGHAASPSLGSARHPTVEVPTLS